MKTQWEYDLVEKPFCEQLKGMGWDWLEGDTDVPELTERENFREVLLKGTLAHPNELLLDATESMLYVNLSRAVLAYI